MDSSDSDRDPVEELADFLGRREFTIDLRTLELEVPDRLGVRPRVGAVLEVYQIKRPAVLALRMTGEPRRDRERDSWRCTFKVVERKALTYKPGEDFWAGVDLPDGMRFAWLKCRSQRFQFEVLTRPPTLYETSKTANTGTLERRVQLRVLDGTLPAVPDVLPAVP